MNNQVLSDLHFEFHQVLGKEFITNYLAPCLPHNAIDVLVIAVDLCVGKSILVGLNFLADVYKKVPIIYVPGNHEYYHSSFGSMEKEFRELADRYKNLYILDNKFLVLDGYYFVGSTLWFPEFPGVGGLLPRLSDASCIANFTNEVFSENKKCVDFLKWHVSRDSIVVTHMLPSPKSISEKYKGNSLNELFMCDMDFLIEERQPKLWIHGHTHESTNYLHGKTHVVCNPLGYVGHDVNASFLPNMVFDVGNP